MPFLTRNRRGQRVMFFCQTAEPTVWKTFVKFGDREPIRIDTGFPAATVECSPTAWQDEAGWHVTLIAGGSQENQAYWLYRMDGETLTSLGTPQPVIRTSVGFQYRDRIVSGSRGTGACGFIKVTDAAGTLDISLPGVTLYRVSYRADAPDMLLISGERESVREIVAVEYNLVTGEQNEIEIAGQQPYKPTFYGDEVIYAERIGDGFEDRELRYSESRHVRRCRCKVCDCGERHVHNS